MRPLSWLTILLVATWAGASAKEAVDETIDPATLLQEIQALEDGIEAYRKDLETTQDQAGELESDLEDNEKQQNALIQRVRELEGDLDFTRRELRRLQNRESHLLASSAEQRHYLSQQIRAAYRLGNQEYFKVLLNQQDPDEIARMLAYYDYLNTARASQIGGYRETLAELTTVTRAVEDRSLALVDMRNDLELEQQLLLESRTRREKTLAQLRVSITTAGSEIARRERNRSQLESLLARIESGFGGLGASDAPFRTLHGSLPMPVIGKVVNRFGSRRAAGKLRWNGIFIAADQGDPVRAIHYGRVVFSDWLRGFGLLLIISHGEGYMSLYGHNEVLLRKTGDWVTAGEAVAAVGRTGGADRDGLYFEIRSSGKPTDPQRWCRAQRSSELG